MICCPLFMRKPASLWSPTLSPPQSSFITTMILFSNMSIFFSMRYRFKAWRRRLQALWTAEKMMSVVTLSFFFMASGSSHSMADEWKSGIVWPIPSVIDPGPPTALPSPIPSDAIRLFDGKNLDAWHSGDKWLVHDGVAQVRNTDITSRESFGDCQVHLEFRTPDVVSGTGQGRGNSGIFLMGLYELQILDSFDNETYSDGQCGAIYKQHPPMVNACRKPGAWQSFDIHFQSPRFNPDGSVKRAAIIDVAHNGVAIHTAVQIAGTTAWDSPPQYLPHAATLPLRLQNHGNPVEFRNIWVRPLVPIVGSRPQ